MKKNCSIFHVSTFGTALVITYSDVYTLITQPDALTLKLTVESNILYMEKKKKMCII